MTTARCIAVARKLTVAMVGFAVVAVGLVLIVTPAPASVVIPLGLAILATEFRWARKLLDTVRRWILPGRSYGGAFIVKERFLQFERADRGRRHIASA